MNSVARLVRFASATTFLVGLLAARSLALPGGVHACSCVPTEPGAPVFDGTEEVVFVGTAGPMGALGRHDFTVERWFKGGDAPVVQVQSAQEFFADGTSAINTCGLTFDAGERMLITAGQSNGVVQPFNCAPNARADSPDFQRLVAAAAATFGEGRPPGQPPPTDTPPTSAGIDLATVALLLVAATVALGLLVVIVAVVRGARADRSA